MKSLLLRPLVLLALTFCFLAFVHPPKPGPTFPAIWKYINNRLYMADRSLSGLPRDKNLPVNGPVIKRFVDMRTQTSRASAVSPINTFDGGGAFSRFGSLNKKNG